jgi:riboflavin synthase
MFTGIVTAIGRVAAVEAAPGADTLFRVEGDYDANSIAIGASISHAGVCLTVLERGAGAAGAWWTVQASAETLSRTTLGAWSAGATMNLERALKAGDELGGHVVSGHVDGVGVVTGLEAENESWRLFVRAPRPLHRFIAAKGSITVDGVSLTVNTVEDDVFGLNIIPHTWAVTTLSSLAIGSRVNLEIDMLARYMARLLETQSEGLPA